MKTLSMIILLGFSMLTLLISLLFVEGAFDKSITCGFSCVFVTLLSAVGMLTAANVLEDK